MYKAKVVKLAVKPHPNADKLQLGYVQGVQIIVGMDTQDGEIGVFFPCDGQLAQDFLSLHNLYRHSHLNEDTTKTGYFSDNGRVTVEKIRGERSDGFYCPLHCFDYTNYDLRKLSIGDEFDELNGIKICKKYYTRATRKAMQKRGKKAMLADYNLPKHYDTEQLQYNLDKIDAGDLVIITEKLHGTSARIGYVQVERTQNLKWWQKLYNKLPFPNYPEHTKYFEFVVGTRNTIASEWVKPDSRDYYRLELVKPLEGQLKKGECVYTEIVGFDSYGKPIMNPQGTNKLKEIKKVYGDVMQYTYGCAWNDVNKPQQKMFVYRITQVNTDGIAIELSWNQIKMRADQLGLEYVPQLDSLFIIADSGCLMGIANNLVAGDSELSYEHIREGVCVRLEKADGQTKVYKHKSFEFKMLEGILKNNDDYIDIEEIS